MMHIGQLTRRALALVIACTAGTTIAQAGPYNWGFGPTGGLQYGGYSNYYGYTAGYAPAYSSFYAPSDWVGGCSSCGSGCSSCGTAAYGPAYAYGGACCTPCGVSGCNSCGTCGSGCSSGDCATGGCANGNCGTGCTSNLAPTGSPTPIPDNRPAAPPRTYDTPVPSRNAEPTYRAPAITTPMTPAAPMDRERDGFTPRDSSDAPMFSPSGSPTSSGARAPMPAVPTGRGTFDPAPMNNGRTPAPMNTRTPAPMNTNPVSPAAEPDFSNRPDYSQPADDKSDAPADSGTSDRKPAPMEVMPIEPTALPMQYETRITSRSDVKLERRSMTAQTQLPRVMRTVVRPTDRWAVPESTGKTTLAARTQP